MADKTKEYISVITGCAKGFEEVFLDKNYLIIYKDDTNAYRSVETIAYKSSYLHLTGLKQRFLIMNFLTKQFRQGCRKARYSLINKATSRKK